MTWKKLIKEFDQRFGPKSRNPVQIEQDYISPKTGIYEFLRERLMSDNVAQKFRDAHFEPNLWFMKRELRLEVKMRKDHPLWDQTIRYGKDCAEETVLTVARKKLPNGSWGCRLVRDGEPADLEKEVDLFSQCGCIGQLEQAFVWQYEKVRTIDLALKKLTPEELVTLREAFQSLLTLGYGYMELCISRPSISWYPDSNLIIDATRNRLLGNLERFKEESAKSIF